MAQPIDLLHPARHAAPGAVPTFPDPSTFTFAKLADVGGDLIVNIAVAALILIATVFVSRWAATLVERALGGLKVSRHDRTLQQFGSALARYVVVVLGLIAVLQRLGVQTTSIIAVLGAASLAIGLALQGALSNVAAGVLILLLRPYRVGDQVEMGGQVGSVRRLDLFTTSICTKDNRKVVVPNAKAMGDVLINRTAYETRRADIDFDVARESDLDQVFAVLKAAASAHPEVRKEPEPWVGVMAIKDSSILVTLYAWTTAGAWFQVGVDLRKAGIEAFRREGVEIPYPRQVGLTPETDPGEPPARVPASEQPIGRA
jgi:small conductance mechanosensitive channel